MTSQERSQSLNQLNKDIKERELYLKTINEQIEETTLAGNNALRVLQGEVEQLELKKSKLLRELLYITREKELATMEE